MKEGSAREECGRESREEIAGGNREKKNREGRAGEIARRIAEEKTLEEESAGV